MGKRWSRRGHKSKWIKGPKRHTCQKLHSKQMRSSASKYAPVSNADRLLFVAQSKTGHKQHTIMKPDFELEAKVAPSTNGNGKGRWLGQHFWLIFGGENYV